MPRVSIVMPVNNGEMFVKEAIQSVLNQSFLDWELLIINDSSTDSTLDRIQGFNDDRIRVFSLTSNGGIAKALNVGLQESSGEFIARLDSDDVSRFDRLEVQTRFLLDNPDYGLVGSWMRTFGSIHRTVRYPTTDEEIRLALSCRTPFGHPAVMFRRAWDLGSTGYYNELAKAEDFDLWMRISDQWKCRNLPRVLTYYRTHPNQETGRHKQENEYTMNILLAIQNQKIGIPPLDKRAHLSETFHWWRIAGPIFRKSLGVTRGQVRKELTGEIVRRAKLKLRKRFDAFTNALREKAKHERQTRNRR